MSAEVIKLVQSMNKNELDTQLALQCAPLLIGIKVSNILIVDASHRESIISMFENTCISVHIMYEFDLRIAFLLYRRYELLRYLSQRKVRDVMQSFGYRRYQLDDVLCEFSYRYTNYMLTKRDFPHEMGVILGYPLEDVMGFINNEGKNFLYSGYWKVYSNLSAALDIFEQYNKAKETVIRMILQEVSVGSILSDYEVQTAI